MRGSLLQVYSIFRPPSFLDVEAQSGGDAGRLTPRYSATPIRCIYLHVSAETCVKLPFPPPSPPSSPHPPTHTHTHLPPLPPHLLISWKSLQTAFIPHRQGAEAVNMMERCTELASVEAWFSTALDIDEVLSGVGGDQLHVMVADVIKSFDTVHRSILDCTLGRLGLPEWFRKTYSAYHRQVRLRFQLAAGLGEPWCRDGGIPQLGAVILSLCLMLVLSFMLIILSVVQSVLVPFLILLGSQLNMSGLLVKMYHLVSVFFSVPLNRSGRP